jgi:hypothetical protein
MSLHTAERRTVDRDRGQVRTRTCTRTQEAVEYGAKHGEDSVYVRVGDAAHGDASGIEERACRSAMRSRSHTSRAVPLIHSTLCKRAGYGCDDGDDGGAEDQGYDR